MTEGASDRGAGPGGRGRTRETVLAAAEELFAEGGFDATRLEDIAERVGIRRASIVYYFKDKRELYEAVLGRVFGDLQATLAEALGGGASAAARIEAGVSAWVDFVGRRPSVARLLLREIANASPAQRSTLVRHTAPFTELIQKEILDRPDFRDAALSPADPVQIASTIAGSTVFLVAAMPALLPERQLDPLSRERLELHKREMLRIVERLVRPKG